MKSQTNKLWPRVLSLVLSLSLVAGLMPAALASSPHQHTSQCPKELSCTYKDFPVDPTNPNRVIICGQEASDAVPGHKHSADCYPNGDENQAPTCGKEIGEGAVEGHTHTDECYHTHDDNCYTYTCTPVTGVTVAPGSMSLSAGGTATLEAILAPSGATIQGVTWSSNSSTITVNSSTGAVTVSSGAAAGDTAIITATTEDGGYTDSCTITVSAAAVSSVSISPASASVAPGGTQQLTATVSPSSANQTVTWAVTSGPATVNASTGLVKVDSSAAAGSTIKVTATAAGDATKTASCTITVTGTATGVTVTPATYSLVPGGTTALSASVAPAAVSQAVTWSSGNASVATVDSSGKVTVNANAAVGSTVRITATSTADGSKSGYATITVISPLTLSKSSVSVAMGSTTSLRATTVPSSSASSVRT